MFGDAGWNESRSSVQWSGYQQWLTECRSQQRRLAIIECGAGAAIPTVRKEGERVAREFGAVLIRINLRDPHVPQGGIGVPLSALDALRRMDQRLSG